MVNRRELLVSAILTASGVAAVAAETGTKSAPPELDRPLKETRRQEVSKESDNKAIVGRWFTEFWGKTFNPSVIDDLAAPDMLQKYSLHEPRRGRA